MSVEAMSWALNVPIGGNAKVILLGLANHASAEFTDARPSVATLARYANCDRRTVQRNLRQLEAEGWIRSAGVFALSGRSDRSVQVWELAGRQIVAPFADGAASEDSRGGVSVANGAAPAPPEPSYEPSNEQTSLELVSKNRDTNRASADVQAVWKRYQELIPNGQRYKFRPESKRIIEGALEARTLDECLLAVQAFSQSTFHMNKGFRDIRYALRGAKSVAPEATIDKWLAEIRPQQQVVSEATRKANRFQAGIAASMYFSDEELEADPTILDRQPWHDDEWLEQRRVAHA